MPAITDAQVQQRLATETQTLVPLIEDTVVFIDTVSILSPCYLTSADFHRLRELGCGKIIPYPSQSRLFGYRLQLPSRRGIDYLNRRLPDHRVGRFDVSMDSITASGKSAAAIDAFLQQRITQPWHGQRQSTVFEETLYAGRRGCGRNIAIYATRPSKRRNEPCAHLELRYETARACARRGVRCLNDLLTFDPSLFLSHDTKLSAINWTKAERVFDTAVTDYLQQLQRSMHRVSAITRRTGSRITRCDAQEALLHILSLRLGKEGDISAISDLEGYSIMKCLDAFKPLQRCMVSIPVSILIKAPHVLF